MDTPVNITTPCGRYTLKIERSDVPNSKNLYYCLIDNEAKLPEFDAANWIEIASGYNVVAGGWIRA